MRGMTFNRRLVVLALVFAASLVALIELQHRGTWRDASGFDVKAAPNVGFQVDEVTTGMTRTLAVPALSFSPQNEGEVLAYLCRHAGKMESGLITSPLGYPKYVHVWLLDGRALRIDRETGDVEQLGKVRHTEVCEQPTPETEN